ATQGSGGAAPEAAPHPSPRPPRAAPHPPLQQPLLHHRGMDELAPGVVALLPGAGVVHHRLHPRPAPPRRPRGLRPGEGDEHHPRAARAARAGGTAPRAALGRPPRRGIWVRPSRGDEARRGGTRAPVPGTRCAGPVFWLRAPVGLPPPTPPASRKAPTSSAVASA